MKITIESTTSIVEILSEAGSHPVPARIWEGVTESGIRIQCLVTRIAVSRDQDCSQFEAELQEKRAPSAAWSAFPLRLIL